MIPFYTQCRPISHPNDIEDVISDPPLWVDKVIPLKPRSAHVIRNTLADCHSEESHFFVRTRIDSRTVPKTLVCHDYKGGYLGDSYIPFEGRENRGFVGGGYPFYNWSQIDYFVYFSHHFITIPPLCWINAGHQNGVKVLGTLITENDDGMKICDEIIFKDVDSMQEFASNLTEITRTFGVDGWLLNIENEVKKPQILVDFVKLLTELIHEENSKNVVIWYDSVIKDGKLQWQNQLNNENRCFFDGCDGIFLNYGWDEQKLINTVETAGHRKLDVFVGIDVFGRNMYGGGQFNTYKAAEMISRYNLSLAIFAPGWTHETLEKDPSGSFFNRFLSKDDAFWCSLWPYLYTHPISNYFETDFHIGLKQHYLNIFTQNQQLTNPLYPEKVTIVPNHESIPTLSNTCRCLQRSTLDSKVACLLTNEHLRTNTTYVHHLFACDIDISGTTSVYLMLRKISQKDTAALTLTLLTSTASGALRKIKLLSDFKDNPVNNCSILEVNPKLNPWEDSFNNLYCIGRKYSLYVARYEFETTPCNIMEIGGTVDNGYSIFLCKIGIKKIK